MRAVVDTEMSKERRDNMRLTSRLGCFIRANVMPLRVLRQALSNASARSLPVRLKKARDEAAQRRDFARPEVDRPAQRHRDYAEAGHLLRGIGALGGSGAEPLDDRAAELLRDNSADEVDGADHSSPARQPTQ